MYRGGGVRRIVFILSTKIVRESRKFNLTYNEIVEQCQITANAMERDIIDLQQFGITQSVIDNFREAISAAASLPNDEYLTGLTMIAHENRDRKAGEVRQMLAGIAARVGAVFGRQSAAYKALGA